MSGWVSRVVTGLLLVAAVPLSVAAVARALGYTTLIVSGSSMGSAVPLGALAIARSVDRNEVRVDNVILVEPSSKNATPYLHRVIARRSEGPRIHVQTQGDANQKADPGSYALPRQVKVTVAAIPLLGYLLRFLMGRAGLALLVALLPAVVVARWALRHWHDHQSQSPAMGGGAGS